LHTILVVDDNKNILDFCKREFEREGYRVLLAGDAREGLQVLDAQKPDLLVTDLEGTLDRGFMRFIRRAWDRDIPIVIHSAGEPDQADAIFCQAEAFVGKTGDVAELKAKIAEVLKWREAGTAGDFVDDEPVGSDDLEGRPWDGQGVD
jgi:DNA-binding response OmpR family regulator